MTLSDFARRHGVSYGTVYEATKVGRLRESFSVVDGRRTIHDVELADREWAAGAPKGKGGVRHPSPPPAPPPAPTPPPAAALDFGAATFCAMVARAAPTWEVEEYPSASGPADLPPAVIAERRFQASLRESEKGITLDEAVAAEKFWSAQQRELKVREKAGELIQVSQVETAITTMVVAARTKLLGLPTRAKQRIPHLEQPDLDILDVLVREILEDLSTSSLDLASDEDDGDEDGELAA